MTDTETLRKLTSELHRVLDDEEPQPGWEAHPLTLRVARMAKRLRVWQGETILDHQREEAAHYQELDRQEQDAVWESNHRDDS